LLCGAQDLRESQIFGAGRGSRMTSGIFYNIM
jgi:hypothetical protein